MDEVNQMFALNLREMIDKSGVTQTEWARRAKLSAGQMSRIVCGKDVPQFLVLWSTRCELNNADPFDLYKPRRVPPPPEPEPEPEREDIRLLVAYYEAQPEAVQHAVILHIKWSNAHIALAHSEGDAELFEAIAPMSSAFKGMLQGLVRQVAEEQLPREK